MSAWNPFKTPLGAGPQQAVEETYRLLIRERNQQVSKDYYPRHEETFMNPLRMIAMRLRLKEGESMPFQSMNACQKSDGSSTVFVLHKDVPLVLEDSEALFPSDTLISQLHLLLK